MIRLSGGRTATLGGVRFNKTLAIIIIVGAVDGLLKDGLRLIDLELGLEVGYMVTQVAAVGAATGVVETEVLVRNVIVHGTPV